MRSADLLLGLIVGALVGAYVSSYYNYDQVAGAIIGILGTAILLTVFKGRL